MATTHVAKDGTITIPAEVAQELDLREGDPLSVEIVRIGRRIVLRDESSVIEKTAGIFREYAKNGPSDPSELRDWYERAVADDVVESMWES